MHARGTGGSRLGDGGREEGCTPGHRVSIRGGGAGRWWWRGGGVHELSWPGQKLGVRGSVCHMAQLRNRTWATGVECSRHWATWPGDGQRQEPRDGPSPREVRAE